MLQAQAGMARVDIPHLIAFAGNLNVADGGSQRPALNGVMRAYGVFDALDRPFFVPVVLPSDLPISLGNGFAGEYTNADDIRYASYVATSPGTRTITLVVQDPADPDKRIGDWDLHVFSRSIPQVRNIISSTRQGDTTVKVYSFDAIQDEKYIIRVMRTVPFGSLAIGPCNFIIRIE